MGAGWRMSLAAAVLLIAAPAVAQMVKPEGLKPVSAHVQVIPDNSAPLTPNVGFVVGTKAVLVIDTGLGPANGAIVAATAETLAPGRTIYLVSTHAHPEHDLGAQAFPASTKMVRSRDQVADIADQGLRLAQVFSARSPAIAELLKGADFRKADIVFDKSWDVDLGGVSARVLALGPNHTAGDTAVWVAADAVLFSGDVAMKAQPSIMAARTSVGQWMSALDGLEKLGPKVVVPSHGPVGDVGFIQGYRAYLKEVAQRTAAAKAAGQTLETATATITEAMAGRYPDKARLGGAMRLAWEGK